MTIHFPRPATGYARVVATPSYAGIEHLPSPEESWSLVVAWDDSEAIVVCDDEDSSNDIEYLFDGDTYEFNAKCADVLEKLGMSNTVVALADMLDSSADMVEESPGRYVSLALPIID